MVVSSRVWTPAIVCLGRLKAQELDWECQTENLPGAFQLVNRWRVPEEASLLSVQLWESRLLNHVPGCCSSWRGLCCTVLFQPSLPSTAWTRRRVSLRRGAHSPRCDQPGCGWWKSRYIHADWHQSYMASNAREDIAVETEFGFVAASSAGLRSRLRTRVL